MKFFGIFGLLAVVVCCIRAEELTKENAIAVAMACKDEAGASDDDVAAFKAHQAQVSHEGKCMVACFMQKFGIMNEDGKLVKDVAIEVAKAMINEEDKKDLAADLVDGCESLEVDDDHCEAAAQYGKCMKEHAKELGLSPGEA